MTHLYNLTKKKKEITKPYERIIQKNQDEIRGNLI